MWHHFTSTGSVPRVALIAMVLLTGLTAVAWGQIGVRTPASSEGVTVAHEYAWLALLADGRVELIRADERTIMTPPPTTSPMPTKSELPRPRGFQYETFRQTSDGLVVLNALSEQGWEVISTSPAGGQPQLLLRRPI